MANPYLHGDHHDIICGSVDPFTVIACGSLHQHDVHGSEVSDCMLSSMFLL